MLWMHLWLLFMHTTNSTSSLQEKADCFAAYKEGGGDECVQMGEKYSPDELHVSLEGETVIDSGTEAVCFTTPATLMLTCERRQQCSPQPVFLL